MPLLFVLEKLFLQPLVIKLIHPQFDFFHFTYKFFVQCFILLNPLSKLRDLFKNIKFVNCLNFRNIKHSYKKGNKDIVEVKPKYVWITSHTYHRSCCTNEFLAGTPVELIKKISGHKSVKDFSSFLLKLKFFRQRRAI